MRRTAEDMRKEFESTPHGIIKALHEIAGMAHAGGIICEDEKIEELFFKIESQVDSLIEGLEI